MKSNKILRHLLPPKDLRKPIDPTTGDPSGADDLVVGVSAAPETSDIRKAA
jgi:hypothetical protein